MKIGLVRHFKVIESYKWVSKSNDFEKWVKDYDVGEIEYSTIPEIEVNHWDICYASNLSRAIKTADHLYDGEIIVNELLKEVPMAAFTKLPLYLPHHVWLFLSRVLFLFSHKSQPESLDEVKIRVKKYVKILLSRKEENVLVISHGFLMRYIAKELCFQGFKGDKFYRPENGKLYMYEN